MKAVKTVLFLPIFIVCWCAVIVSALLYAFSSGVSDAFYSPFEKMLKWVASR